MTTREQFVGTLGKLLEATRAKQLAWKETAEEGVYRASFKKATVEVGRFEDEEVEQHYLQARLYNKNNAVVEEIKGSLSNGNTKEPSPLLRALYELARDSALRPEDLLKSIEDELMSAQRQQ
ncbi:MAG TPA: hypothetical protein VKA46_35715 [Gemmataceae bacterium]|nr:hypothetical protein [Gemmataceae bacterium]